MLPVITPEFVGQSDRACGVLAGAMFDTILETLLRKNMTPGKGDELFSAYGPLGTLAAKIELALAFGLITEGEGADLHRIRRIRNEFAHTLDVLSFASQPISDHLSQLRYSASAILKRQQIPRRDFEKAVMVLQGFLSHRIKNAQVPTPPPEIDMPPRRVDEK